MKSRTFALYLLAAACLLACAAPVMAGTADQPTTVLYQTSFSTDPKWTTNNPSMDYWDPGLQMYHFGIEPSTGAYAYVPIDGYEGGPFTFEYDVIINRIDEGATFRMGFSGADMNPEKGPNVLTVFTNAKFGQIMWLRLVTPGNKLSMVNSKSGDTLSSGADAYDGPTANYELNKTYHVTVTYNTNDNIVSMKVNEKTSGKEIWGYFLKAGDDLHGMNRIYLGSIGDYGMMSIYAKGYIDNVRLTVPTIVAATETTAPAATQAAVTSATPTRKITKSTATIPPTPGGETTPESPLPATTTVLALGAAAAACGVFIRRKD